MMLANDSVDQVSVRWATEMSILTVIRGIEDGCGVVFLYLVPARRKLRREDNQFQASLGYILEYKT